MGLNAEEGEDVSGVVCEVVRWVSCLLRHAGYMLNCLIDRVLRGCDVLIIGNVNGVVECHTV